MLGSTLTVGSRVRVGPRVTVGATVTVSCGVIVGRGLTVGPRVTVGCTVTVRCTVKLDTDELLMYPVMVGTGYVEKVGIATDVVVGSHASVGVGAGPASATWAAATVCATAPRDDITPAA